ncbi:MAG: hypothetical protein A2091_06025 [Desulfuromonadales bacterium GWD2_61_12]|nr:MAG: hypothetical protein A2005_07425 [Desulfuromonadales bacterium GWC2_61_20]OGR36404.1 MAG: hypothetical protein A2091_06025 [Desulfuromonadales bacterium GWD2_61_12]
MPRIARTLADECCYHLINRGNGRQQVFHKDGDYQAFIDLLLQWRGDYGMKILAWCLMPNHFHLLVQPAAAAQLHRWMRRLMTTHVRRYHKHYGTSGHLWQGRYKGFLVQNDDHLLTVARYVEGNPVRARLVATAAEWPWSSHRARKAETEDVRPDAFPCPLPVDWGAFVDTPLAAGEIEKLRNSVNRQAPFGNDAWQDKLCVALGLESTVRQRGWQKGRKREIGA